MRDVIEIVCSTYSGREQIDPLISATIINLKKTQKENILETCIRCLQMVNIAIRLYGGKEYTWFPNDQEVQKRFYKKYETLLQSPWTGCMEEEEKAIVTMKETASLMAHDVLLEVLYSNCILVGQLTPRCAMKPVYKDGLMTMCQKIRLCCSTGTWSTKMAGKRQKTCPWSWDAFSANWRSVRGFSMIRGSVSHWASMIGGAWLGNIFRLCIWLGVNQRIQTFPAASLAH